MTTDLIDTARRQLDELVADKLDVEARLAAIVGPDAAPAEEPEPPAVPEYGALYRRDPDDGTRYRYLAGCNHDAYVWWWENAPAGTPSGSRWLDDDEAGRLVPAT